MSVHRTEDISSILTEKYKLLTCGATRVGHVVVLHVAFVKGDDESEDSIVYSCSRRERCYKSV